MNKLINKQVAFQDLGLIDYQQAWDYQTELLDSIVELKRGNRGLEAEQHKPTPNYLLFCEHPHVYTLGKSGKEEHVLLAKKELEAKNIAYHKINRGGDITYHGPGQIVGYPVIDLENFFTDIHKYLRLLEESIILTLAHYGLKGDRIKGATGVWLDSDKGSEARKICAMGIRCSRWVSMHGWAFNVNTDLDYFKNIIPCGIQDKGVTSLNKELNLTKVDITETKNILKENFAKLFEASF